MTDPPIDLTQAREQDAPGTHDAKRQAPVHGHTGDLPSDKALSDNDGPCAAQGPKKDPAEDRRPQGPAQDPAEHPNI
eukprot:scaffold13448_cov109-Isochrysis_galbana.AAC.8